MSAGNGFFWNYLPFWTVNFALAALGWTALGRMLLGIWLPPHSSNYIWRFFCRLTDWPLRAIALITPGYVSVTLLPAFLAFWCFLLRWIAFIGMHAAGLTPSVAS